MKITAVLVSHNGSRWLPEVLDALGKQQADVERFVCVDTGSTDDSVDLLTAAFGQAPIALPPDTGYGAAVQAALDSLPPSSPEDWIWLLHDDSSPHPECLRELRAAAEACDPSTVALGPKIRDWPNLRRLLEVGVTVTGTGRRETWLEPGEPDQGQHDDKDRVLAVNTAGMLVRRDVLEYFGIASELPLFANDLDFGWRLASRSMQTRVVPSAVMFHAEAAFRGLREGELSEHPRRDARAASMFVVLANGSRRWHLVRLVRMFVSGILRALGFSLIRAFAEARAELAALRLVYGPSRRHHRARRARQAAASASPSELKGLLAPVWLPWRHGLDFVIAFFQALIRIGIDRGRAWADEQAAKGPLGARVLHSPTTYALLLAFLAALIAERHLMGSGPIAGGALLPAPDGPGHWWSLWWSSWHWIGGGSSAAAPPYALPMAVASSLTFGQPALLIWLIFGMGVPLAGLGAWRLSVQLNLSRWAQAWGCLTYALVPVALGAVDGGHLGTMVVAILLPWLAKFLWSLSSDSAEVRERSVWRSVLVGGLAACFGPVLLVAMLIAAVFAPRFGADSLTLRQRLTLGLGPVLLSLPWLVDALRHPWSLTMEAGAATTGSHDVSFLEALTGVLPGGSGVWPWLLMGIPAAAVIALARPTTRVFVLRCWTIAALAAGVAALYSAVTIDLPGRPDFAPYLGVPLLVQMGALLLAVLGATAALRGAVVESSFGYRQMVVSAVALMALIAPIAGLVAWVAAPDGALRGDGSGVTRAAIPAYLADAGAASPIDATLIVTGSGSGENGGSVHYVIQRSPTVLGDDAVLALTTPDPAVQKAVSNLISGHPDGAGRVLASRGVAYVYAPSPVDPLVAQSFDTATEFTVNYPPNPAARAWQIAPRSNDSAIERPGNLAVTSHRLALGIQVLVLMFVLVLAAPGRSTHESGRTSDV